MKKTASDIISCYGKKANCPDRADCDWSAPCLNRARELLDDIHYQKQHISVPQIFYDPNDDPGDGENNETKAYFEAEASASPSYDLHLDGITIPEDALPCVIQVIEKIADFYFHTPHTFEVLMHTVMKGKSQSDIAREKHITRQCENKRLLREIGIAQKRNDIQQRRDRELAEAKRAYSDKLEELRSRDEFFKTLSDRDWMIYKLVFVDGCSYQSTAKQVGCSEKTVYSVTYFLRSKLNKNYVISRGRKKKIAKKSEIS